MIWPPAHAEAAAEFRAYIEHLRTNADVRIAEDFIFSAERALKQACRFPESGSPFGEARRIVIQGFPLDLVYVADEGDVYIVAFAHHRRRPGYWRTRL